jgi:hypothetical protein
MKTASQPAATEAQGERWHHVPLATRGGATRELDAVCGIIDDRYAESTQNWDAAEVIHQTAIAKGRTTL